MNDTIIQLPVYENFMSTALLKEVAAFNRRVAAFHKAQASARASITAVMDSIDAGKFSRKDIAAINAGMEGLLLFDAEEINLHIQRMNLFRQFESDNRAAREALQNQINARRDEICKEGEKADEADLVIDARIRTDKQLLKLVEAMPADFNPTPMHQAEIASKHRIEELRTQLKSYFNL
ncbi:hypothetical protein P0Y35_05875 [Kiritimatiellaeota bacterium B1221]|nr:hypothetical protein [Kiritimatiellaeota bacterium B1221]